MAFSELWLTVRAREVDNLSRDTIVTVLDAMPVSAFFTQ
jgi:hypothetical protein